MNRRRWLRSSPIFMEGTSDAVLKEDLPTEEEI